MSLTLSTTVDVVLPVAGFGDVRFTIQAQTQAAALRWRYEVSQASDAVGDFERAQALEAEAQELGQRAELEPSEAAAIHERLREINAEGSAIALRQAELVEAMAASLGSRIVRAKQVSSEQEVVLPEGETWARALLSHSMGLEWVPKLFHAYHAAITGKTGK